METRPLTGDEKAALAMHGRPVGREMARRVLFSGFVLTGLLFAVSFSVWKWLGPQLGFVSAKNHLLPVLLLSMAVAVIFIGRHIPSMFAFARKQAEPSQKAKADLAAGLARQIYLDVTAALEAPEYEDEGVGFFLQLTDGRVLYVQGQDLYDHAHDAADEEGKALPKTFPSTRILYACGPQSGIRLSITPQGTYLPPALLQARRYADADAIPADGAFYNGALDDMMARFKLRRA